MYHILAAIDHDLPTIFVKEIARQLAKATGANLHFFHVGNPNQNPKKEERWLEDVRHVRGITSDRIHAGFSTGDPATCILAESERIRADLIIMGRTIELGQSNRVHTVDRVIQRATSPVMAIPVAVPNMSTKKLGNDNQPLPVTESGEKQ